jgi:hypothetical protein
VVDFVNVSLPWNTDLEEVLQNHFISLLNNYRFNLLHEIYNSSLPSIFRHYTVFLGEIIVAKLVKKFPALYGNLVFFLMLARIHHWITGQ